MNRNPLVRETGLEPQFEIKHFFNGWVHMNSIHLPLSERSLSRKNCLVFLFWFLYVVSTFSCQLKSANPRYKPGTNIPKKECLKSNDGTHFNFWYFDSNPATARKKRKHHKHFSLHLFVVFLWNDFRQLPLGKTVRFQWFWRLGAGQWNALGYKINISRCGCENCRARFASVRNFTVPTAVSLLKGQQLKINIDVYIYKSRRDRVHTKNALWISKW